MKKIIYSIFLSFHLAFAQIPTSGLVAFYPFNNNVKDSLGHALNDGKNFITNSQPFVLDRTQKGYACNFDGVDDYIIIPNKSSFNFNNPQDTATIFLWFNAGVCNKQISGKQSIFDAYELSTTGKRRSLTIFITNIKDSQGKQSYLIELMAIVSNNTDTELIVIPYSLNDTGWHSVCIVWKKSSLKFYADGILSGEKSPTITDARLSSNNKTTAIGTDVITASKFFCGYIDDLRLYNRILSDSEIKSLAQDGISKVISSKYEQVNKKYEIIIKSKKSIFVKNFYYPHYFWPPKSVTFFTLQGKQLNNIYGEIKDNILTYFYNSDNLLFPFSSVIIVKLLNKNDLIYSFPMFIY
jgi:hypothetical protein